MTETQYHSCAISLLFPVPPQQLSSNYSLAWLYANSSHSCLTNWNKYSDWTVHSLLDWSYVSLLFLVQITGYCAIGTIIELCVRSTRWNFYFNQKQLTYFLHRVIKWRLVWSIANCWAIKIQIFGDARKFGQNVDSRRNSST